VTDIISKIKEVRNKPDETKKKILWIMVFVCMVFVSGIWIYGFMNTTKDADNWSGMNVDKYRNYDELTDDLKGLEKEKDESMGNVAFEIEKNEIAAIVNKYIDENNVIDGMSSNDVILAKEEKIDGVWKLEYKQLYKNIPVELSDIAISVNYQDKSVNVDKSVYFPGIDLDVSPKLTQAEALEKIKSEVGEENMTANRSEIVIYSIEDSKKNIDHYLSWKMNVYDEKAFFEGTYFVDANTGKLLR